MKLWLIKWNYDLNLKPGNYDVRDAVVRAETPEAAYAALDISADEFGKYACAELTADGTPAVIVQDIRQPGDDY